MPLKSTNRNEKAQNFIPLYNRKQQQQQNIKVYIQRKLNALYVSIVVILVELIEVTNNEKIFLAGKIE